MPRLTSGLPKYRKHASGQARVTVNGRDYLLGPHGTRASKLEYDRVIADPCFFEFDGAADDTIEIEQRRLGLDEPITVRRESE